MISIPKGSPSPNGELHRPPPAGSTPTGRLDLERLLGDSAPDRLTLAILAYLLFPGLLFLLGWVSLWVALPAGLAAVAAFALAPGWRGTWPLSARMTALCLALGLLWAGATGAHHLVYSSADWQIRDAVLRDLAAGPWPVGYQEAGGAQWLLRAPLGFYLPAGLLGRIGGFRAAQIALWLSTGLGFGLVLMLLALVARAVAPGRRGAFALLAIVFILFHGLDLLPNMWLDWRFGTGPLASWGRGGEWWPRLFQYSGHVTAILWAPNHAMPAWLLALLLLRHGRRPEFLRHLALPLAAGAFWSPVASAGAALLAGAVLLRQHGWRAAGLALSPANLLAVLFAIPVCLYLVAGSAAVPHGPLLSVHPGWSTPLVWAVFLLLEVLCWAVPAALLIRGRVFMASVVLLCLLPAYVFGPGNEMTARGGMAPLAVLAVAVAAALLAPQPGRAQQAARQALVGFAVIALGGAAMEASLLLKRPWPASAECPLLEAARHSVFAATTDWAHYLAPWPEEMLSGWLQELPARPAERAAGSAPCWPEGGP
ncbi:hypothetical protein SAMN02745194_04249 [Roseomonas rosea]|uniref:Uncharacterized protein n=1 Tax=Muricoccus roseus TaxID=198092 RepID=A0A1M6PZ74_9PROT|nr:hypothetical protein [Roseomonas rosea]SHK13238.1 hypothetical protein SAMN02745194_04249 [Roseomonas rosea]